MIYSRVHLDEDTQLKLHYNKYILYSISIYLLPTYIIRPLISHSVLISRLEIIGIRGILLKWFSSYILNRSASVKICNFSIKSRPLHYGVPQGSVLGPLLFSISSLYMILLVNFQMSTIKFTLMIFNYIPPYPTPPMY